MLRFLHAFSAILFYVLGASFFLAYVLAHNAISPLAMTGWLTHADLPLLLSGVLYGGLSVYHSLRDPAGGESMIIALAIGLPLVLIFFAFAFMNFWPNSI